MSAVDHVLWWTGVLAWLAVASAAAFVVYLLCHQAVLSGVWLVRIMTNNRPSMDNLSHIGVVRLCARIWWWGVLESPRRVENTETGEITYWPGLEPDRRDD